MGRSINKTDQETDRENSNLRMLVLENSKNLRSPSNLRMLVLPRKLLCISETLEKVLDYRTFS